MVSPAQPPPSPPSSPPPRGRKRSRSPSGERELGAGFDPQLSPPDRSIFPGPAGGIGLNSDSNMKLMFGQSISLGHKVSLGLNSNSNLKAAFLNLKGNEQAPPLIGDQAITSGNNGSPGVKYDCSAFSKDDSEDAKSLLHGDIPLLSDQSIYLGHKGSLGLNSNSNMKLTFLNSKDNEQALQLFGGLGKSKYLLKMTGCEAYTYDDIYSATSGFNEENLMPQFGPAVYQGCLSSVGKVLVKVYNKVHEQIQEYKEGALRRFSPLRVHKNLIRLIGSFSDEKILVLVYRFPFEVSLKDQLKVAGCEKEKGGLGKYARYRIALELAEALNHIVKQDIPLIPKLFTEDHVFIGPKGNPVLVDFIGAAQGLGQAFDSTLEIVRHYGILLGKLRDFKCANGAVLPILDEVWEKLENACIQSNEFKRPSPEEIVYVMKGRTKELFGLTSPMHDEFRRKHNLQW